MFKEYTVRKMKGRMKRIVNANILDYDQSVAKTRIINSCKNIVDTFPSALNPNIHQINGFFKNQIRKSILNKFAKNAQSSPFEASQYVVNYPLGFISKSKEKIPFILAKYQHLYEQQLRQIISSLANEARGTLIIAEQFDKGVITQGFCSISSQKLQGLVQKIQHSLPYISNNNLLDIQIEGVPILQNQICNGAQISYNGFAIRINVSAKKDMGLYPLFEVIYQVHKTTKVLSYLGKIIEKVNKASGRNSSYYEYQKVEADAYEWLVKIAKDKIKGSRRQKIEGTNLGRSSQITISMEKIKNLVFFNKNQKYFLRDKKGLSNLIAIFNDVYFQSYQMNPRSLSTHNQTMQQIELQASPRKLKFLSLPFFKESIKYINDQLQIEYDISPQRGKSRQKPILVCLTLLVSTFEQKIMEIRSSLEKAKISFSFITPIMIQLQKQILDIISDSIQQKIILVLKVFDSDKQNVANLLETMIRSNYFFVSKGLYLSRILTKQQQELYLAFIWDKFVEVPKIKKQLVRNLTLIQFNSQLLNVAIYSFTLFSLSSFTPNFIQIVK